MSIGKKSIQEQKHFQAISSGLIKYHFKYITARIQFEYILSSVMIDGLLSVWFSTQELMRSATAADWLKSTVSTSALKYFFMSCRKFSLKWTPVCRKRELTSRTTYCSSSVDRAWVRFLSRENSSSEAGADKTTLLYNVQYYSHGSNNPMQNSESRERVWVKIHCKIKRKKVNSSLL